VESSLDSALRSLAENIDAQRAAALRGAADGEGAAVALLLGTVFPPLEAHHDWQRQALTRIAQEGWRIARSRQDYVRLLGEECDDSAGCEPLLRTLRRFAWREKARIALRETLPASLGGAALPVTAQEISELAEAVLWLALREASAHVAERYGEPRREGGARSSLLVLGMGKLGGRELNAGSDIDLVFLYDSDEGQGALSLHEHWTRVVRRAVSHLEEASEDGRVWAVDLRLRPEGSRGSLVNSLGAAERYYEAWGRTWERAALLRARAIEGPAELVQQFERDVLTPFVFRHRVEPSLAASMLELAERARLELCSAPERDLKLGIGGIREAEFFVQSLQLIWGGKEPSLRVKGTLHALERLKSRGLVTDLEERAIADAYTLLRRVEHRVQWMAGTQTHLLPQEAAEQQRLARSLGLPDAASLHAQLREARQLVAELFRALAPEAERPPSRYAALVQRLDAARENGGDLEATLLRAAELLGGTEVALHLWALAQRPEGWLSAVSREREPQGAQHLLEALAGAPDPTLAARHLRHLFGSSRQLESYWRLLLADARAANRLLHALGASDFVAEALLRHPDLLEAVMGGVGRLQPPAQVVQEAAAEATAREGDAAVESQEGLVAALRRAKRRVVVETALADLAGELSTRETTRRLSELAEAILEQTVRAVLGPQGRGLSVIAMGKLGGRELGYGSDLDLLFVYEPEAAPSGVEPARHYVKLAQRLIAWMSLPHPEGPGYALDMRLRPSGSQGMLVTSLQAFARYHGLDAQGAPLTASSVGRIGAAWERQVLVRARPCAGDAELGERFLRVVEVAAYELGAPSAEELLALRARMERELGAERPGHYDLKSGRGGLLDIEFAVQWLQMTHGHDRRVRTADTETALTTLVQCGYLERRLHDVFADGYRFLRRLEQRAQILTGDRTSSLDTGSLGLAQLARRMGLQTRGAASPEDMLVSQYLETTSAVRRAFEETLALHHADDG